MQPSGTADTQSEMLKCLQAEGHIYALDVDPIEMEKTRERLQKKDTALRYLPSYRKISLILTRWQNRPESLILFWRIWVFPPCR